MRQNSLVTVLLGAAVVAQAPQAFADDAGTQFALPRLDPAAAGDAFFSVPSAETNGRLAIRAMVFADYAHRPLEVTTINTGTLVSSVVRHQVLAHGNVSVALFDRAVIGVDFPAAFQQGDAFAAGGTSLPAPPTTGTANVRLSGRGRIWSESRGLVHVGVGGYLYLPTTGAYASDARLRGWVHAIANGDVGNRIRYAAAVGPELRESREFLGVNQGSRLTYSAAVGALLGPQRELQVGPEVLGTLSFDSVDSRTTNLDVLVGARYRFLEEFTLGLGAGTALSAGVGSPRVRGMLSFTWAPEIDVAKKEKVSDRDGDGVHDPLDACADTAGVASEDPKKHGCPILDKDSDGILDAVDACMDAVGVASDDAKKHGCPVLDKDGDGVLDAVDACPEALGVADPDALKNGCPVGGDRDGDGIADPVDACAELKGSASADPKTNGCPSDTDGDGVRDDVDACPSEAGADSSKPQHRGCRADAILNLGAPGIEFDGGGVTLRATSDAGLEAVASFLKEHVELVKVEVQAHTDNQGAKRINKTISQDRAGALVAALVKRGVAANRLVAKGYGDEVPRVSNDTPEGQAKNRRVQFLVLEKK